MRPFVSVTLTVTLLAAAACGAGTTSTPSTAPTGGEGGTAYPLTVNNCGRDYVFKEAPKRTVLMNGGSVAEVSTMLALGQGSRIVANAQNYGASDVPGRAEEIAGLPTGDITLNDMQDIPREAMIAQRPDFVVSTYGGGFKGESGFATRDELLKVGANTYVPQNLCTTDGVIGGTPTIEDSYTLLRDFGKIFDASGKAERIIAESRGKIDAVSARVAVQPVKNAVLVFTGMGMGDDFSSIAAVGIWNDILARAGAKNPFATATNAAFATISRETLAATPVDALIVVNYQNPDPAASAKKILDQFPQWAATRNNTFVVLSDSIYFGPSNDIAVTKIAEAVHGS